MPKSDRQSNRKPLLGGRQPGERPVVLFLSCHLPWPPLSGGRRRELELISRLSERFDIRLVVISKTPAEDQAHSAALAPFCRSGQVRYLGVATWNAFLSRTGPACSQKVTNGRVPVAVSDCAISFSWCG